MATTIKEFLVTLGVDPESEALARWDDGIQRARRHMMDLTKVAAGVAAGVAGVGSALFANATKTAEYAKETLRAADALGVTTREFQRLNAATTRFGGEGAKDTQDLLSVLSDRAEDATRGTASFVEAFEMLNIQASELEGLGAREILMRTAEGFQEVGDKQGVVAAERLLGGDLGQKFIPLLKQGSEGIRRLGDRSEELGIILEEKALRQSRAFGKSWEDLTGIFTGFRRLLGAKLAPVLDDLVGRLQRWIESNKDLINQRLDEFAQAAGDAFLALGDALANLDAIAQSYGGWDEFLKILFTWSKRLLALWATAKIGGTIWGLVDAFRGLAGVLPKLAAGNFGAVFTSAWMPAILAVASALGGLIWLVEEIIAYSQGGESVFTSIFSGTGDITAALWELFQILSLIAGGIAALVVIFTGVGIAAAALVAGFVVAVGVAVAAIIAYWDEIVAFFDYVWESIKAGVMAAVDAIARAFMAVGRTLRRIWGAYLNYLSGVWNTIKTGVTAVWNFITGFITGAFDAIVGAASSVANGIVGWFKLAGSMVRSVWDGLIGWVEDTVDWMVGWIEWIGSKVSSFTGTVAGWVGLGGGSETAKGRPSRKARPAGAGGDTKVAMGDTTFNIETRPGQSEEEVARLVEKKRREEERKKHRKAAERLGRGSEA